MTVSVSLKMSPSCTRVRELLLHISMLDHVATSIPQSLFQRYLHSHDDYTELKLCNIQGRYLWLTLSSCR